MSVLFFSLLLIKYVIVLGIAASRIAANQDHVTDNANSSPILIDPALILYLSIVRLV